jgi:hypothetical protein
MKAAARRKDAVIAALREALDTKGLLHTLPASLLAALEGLGAGEGGVAAAGALWAGGGDRGSVDGPSGASPSHRGAASRRLAGGGACGPRRTSGPSRLGGGAGGAGVTTTDAGAAADGSVSVLSGRGGGLSSLSALGGAGYRGASEERDDEDDDEDEDAGDGEGDGEGGFGEGDEDLSGSWNESMLAMESQLTAAVVAAAAASEDQLVSGYLGRAAGAGGSPAAPYGSAAGAGGGRVGVPLPVPPLQPHPPSQPPPPRLSALDRLAVAAAAATQHVPHYSRRLSNRGSAVPVVPGGPLAGLPSYASFRSADAAVGSSGAGYASAAAQASSGHPGGSVSAFGHYGAAGGGLASDASAGGSLSARDASDGYRAGRAVRGAGRPAAAGAAGAGPSHGRLDPADLAAVLDATAAAAAAAAATADAVAAAQMQRQQLLQQQQQQGGGSGRVPHPHAIAATGQQTSRLVQGGAATLSSAGQGVVETGYGPAAGAGAAGAGAGAIPSRPAAASALLAPSVYGSSAAGGLPVPPAFAGLLSTGAIATELGSGPRAGSLVPPQQFASAAGSGARPSHTSTQAAPVAPASVRGAGYAAAAAGATGSSNPYAASLSNAAAGRRRRARQQQQQLQQSSAAQSYGIGLAASPVVPVGPDFGASPAPVGDPAGLPQPLAGRRAGLGGRGAHPTRLSAAAVDGAAAGVFETASIPALLSPVPEGRAKRYGRGHARRSPGTSRAASSHLEDGGAAGFAGPSALAPLPSTASVASAPPEVGYVPSAAEAGAVAAAAAASAALKQKRGRPRAAGAGGDTRSGVGAAAGAGASHAVFAGSSAYAAPAAPPGSPYAKKAVLSRLNAGAATVAGAESAASMVAAAPPARHHHIPRVSPIRAPGVGDVGTGAAITATLAADGSAFMAVGSPTHLASDSGSTASPAVYGGRGGGGTAAAGAGVGVGTTPSPATIKNSLRGLRHRQQVAAAIAAP